MRKVAWGITGAGDKLRDTLKEIECIRERYRRIVDIEVYLSKAAETVLKYYGLLNELRSSFNQVLIEVNSNSPFLASWLQLGEFEFLLIAPATSNTVAKLAYGIADTMITNSAIMALKAYIPVYLMPTDFEPGETNTILPSGRILKFRVRKEDADNVKKLSKIDGLHLLSSPSDLEKIFREHFG
ncbi:MAG: archaeoflavoprotein AfpA [Candidatus Bathyarchaeia archaeon]